MRGAGVGAGQVEQVGDETLEALDLGQHAGLGRHRIGAGGVGQVDLELGPHACQRGAQLVGGIGDEPALAVGGRLDAFEHPVHGAGQAGHLVVAGRDRDSAVEALPADALDLGADRLDRTQRPAHHHPQERGEGDGEDAARRR